MIQRPARASALDQDTQTHLRVDCNHTPASEAFRISNEEPQSGIHGTQLQDIYVLASKSEAKPHLPLEMTSTETASREQVRVHESARCQSDITALMVDLSEKAPYHRLHPLDISGILWQSQNA
eukprot:6490900-Amphidinium_carterae.2